jgi:hypothetical protein
MRIRRPCRQAPCRKLLFRPWTAMTELPSRKPRTPTWAAMPRASYRLTRLTRSRVSLSTSMPVWITADRNLQRRSKRRVGLKAITNLAIRAKLPRMYLDRDGTTVFLLSSYPLRSCDEICLPIAMVFQPIYRSPHYGRILFLEAPQLLKRYMCTS